LEYPKSQPKLNMRSKGIQEKDEEIGSQPLREHSK
jgi:hypothetical protein